MREHPTAPLRSFVGRLTRHALPCGRYGSVFYPPVALLHFNFLDWLVVKTWKVSTGSMPWVKAFMEQFVYWGWFSNAYYHGILGFLQGMTTDQIYHRIADTLWDTMKAQWAFWVPVQLINFRFVPVRHQVRCSKDGARVGLPAELRSPPRPLFAVRVAPAQRCPRRVPILDHFPQRGLSSGGDKRPSTIQGGLIWEAARRRPPPETGGAHATGIWGGLTSSSGGGGFTMHAVRVPERQADHVRTCCAALM